EQLDDALPSSLEKTNLLRCWSRRDRRRSQGSDTLDRGFRPYDFFRQGGLVKGLVIMLDLDLIAGLIGRGVVVPDTLHFVVGGIEMGVRDDQHFDLLTALDFGQVLALLVEQEGGNGNRQNRTDLCGTLLKGLFLDQAHNGQGEGFHATDGALALTAGANLVTGFAQGGTQ